MCGIVGILGSKPVAEDLVDALKRLEYRGYDSAGVATVADGHLARRRAEGKLRNLELRLKADPLAGMIGIGHTRWATHGAPTETNAHPHMAARVSLVHNGIIENYQVLRSELQEAGIVFNTETDTEVIAHLISRALDELEAAGTDEAADSVRRKAVARVLKRLEGAFALAIIFEGVEDMMMAARRGSPLAIGYGASAATDGVDKVVNGVQPGRDVYLGSDAIALAPFTDQITYLEDGDYAVLTRDSVQIFDDNDQPVARDVQTSVASSLTVDKGNHRHFMAKEIHEQPEVIAHTLARYADLSAGRVKFPDFPVDFAKIPKLTITACGTAYYAGLVAKYWFECYARLPVEIDVASEFRYREVPMMPGGMALFISQSGETADTLAGLRYCRAQNQKIAAIVNVRESSIARESDVMLPTLAGPEIGVASTKAFTCQLVVMACLAIHAGRARGVLSAADEQRLVAALAAVPGAISTILANERAYDELAMQIAKADDVLYLGRGRNFPIALEGALKLKEISYIHAEGYAAGELKHGPIALIAETVPVIVIAPQDELFEKTMSNMKEVSARHGQIILLTDDGTVIDKEDGDIQILRLPKLDGFVNPLLYALPVQLLAYHAAVHRGTDVDQPRNLAKSVTVE